MNILDFFSDSIKESITNNIVVLKEEHPKAKCEQKVNIDRKDVIVLKLDCTEVNFFFKDDKKMCDYAILRLKNSNKKTQVFQVLCIELKSKNISGAPQQLIAGERLMQYLLNVYKAQDENIKIEIQNPIYKIVFRETYQKTIKANSNNNNGADLDN